jgi:hypothetical protein
MEFGFNGQQFGKTYRYKWNGERFVEAKWKADVTLTLVVTVTWNPEPKVEWFVENFDTGRQFKTGTPEQMIDIALKEWRLLNVPQFSGTK